MIIYEELNFFLINIPNDNFGSILNIDFLFNDDEGGSELDIDKLRDLIKAESFDVVFIDSVTGLIMGNGISIKDSEFCIPLYELNNLESELKTKKSKVFVWQADE